uniref:Uncharacterized protein n=1 Tax=Meleagris gallopavo TaxID=9103 RepID=A0A803YNA4_MELGA
MAFGELEDLCCHINAKIGCVKKLLQLRAIGREPSLKEVLRNVGQEMAELHGLLDRMEGELNQQRQLAAVSLRSQLRRPRSLRRWC